MNAPPLYGLVIEFTRPERILLATRTACDAGYRQLDAYSPYPVDGLAAALGMRKSRIPALVFCGAVVGAAAGFFMQYYSMAVDYPLNVGGRPLNSWPAFIPVMFEVLVLVASLSAFLGMLFLNGLPRLHHPIFNTPGFERASQDRFFLCVEASDPMFQLQQTASFLAQLSEDGRVLEVFHEQLVEPDVPAEDFAPKLRSERQSLTSVGER